MVGGGSGRRFGALKQYEMLGDRRVIDWSVDVAAASTGGVVVVVPADDAAAESAVAGGATRSESVRAGLAHVPDDAEIICVHDAARPLATPEVYARVIAAVRNGAGGAIPAIGVTDTVKLLAEPFDVEHVGTVVDTPDRSRLVAVQTPQAFDAHLLRSAHDGGSDATDDAALVEALGGTVVVVAGDIVNLKITDPDDLARVAPHLGCVRDVPRRQSVSDTERSSS